jgi:anti-sigma factor RsiW
MMNEMTHIDEGILQALLDGELRLDERRRTERHLEGCLTCRRELDRLSEDSQRFTTAMALLEGVPTAREHAVGWPQPRRLSGVRQILPRAAVLLLFAGAAASATVPGSPVRRWIGELRGPAVVETATPVEPEAAPVAAAAARAEAGVVVEAADGSVEIVLRDASALKVRATLVDGTRAGVFTTGEAASSPFVTAAGRIEVLNPRGGEVRMELPRGAAVVSVIVNGRQVLRKHADRPDYSVEASDDGAAGVDFSFEL